MDEAMKFLCVVGERIGHANKAALVVISIVAVMAVGICWMIKNANRTALIAIAVAVSILLDILLTLAGPLFGGLRSCHKTSVAI